MNYILWGLLAAYLVLGMILTYTILPGPNKRRLSFRDVVMGTLFMPILFVILIFFDLSEEAWARLLVILAFDPPEKMRPGKPKPKSQNLDHQ